MKHNQHEEASKQNEKVTSNQKQHLKGHENGNDKNTDKTNDKTNDKMGQHGKMDQDDKQGSKKHAEAGKSK